MEPEFLMYIAVNILTLGAMYGSMRTQINYIEKSIQRLEDKQDKHNGLIERMGIVEERLNNVDNKVGEHIEDGKNK